MDTSRLGGHILQFDLSTHHGKVGHWTAGCPFCDIDVHASIRRKNRCFVFPRGAAIRKSGEVTGAPRVDVV